MSDFHPSPRIAEELKLPIRAVRAVAQLLADGATVPFIARYRKEQTFEAVDIGVHQDGLVHVSQLSDRFVQDPSPVVRVGDPLKVRVLAVDFARKRISLSAKSSP